MFEEWKLSDIRVDVIGRICQTCVKRTETD